MDSTANQVPSKRCDIAAGIRKRRLEEQAAIREAHANAMEKMKLTTQSDYRREVVERQLAHSLGVAYAAARFPCSPWWKEYLYCVAGKNPLRRPPPYPEFHVQDYLEGVEERYKLSIPIDYERSIKCGVNDRYQPIHRKEMRASSSLPKIRCQDYLEAVEDRYRRSIKTDYEKATKCRLDRF